MAFSPDLSRRLRRLLRGLGAPQREWTGRNRWTSAARPQPPGGPAATRRCAAGGGHGFASRPTWYAGGLPGLRGQRSRGSALVQALMAGLIAVIGVLLLASRLFSSRTNSFARSDTLAAREAAEYGLNELQAQLNTNQRGYLWVTRQANWGNANLLSALNTCNIQALDSTGNQLSALPALPAGVTTPKSIRTVNGATLSYQLRANNGFQPPELPDQDATTVRQEAACGIGTANAAAAANFGNLNGGSAIITVTGTVSRGSGASAKSTNFTLSRRVHVLSPSQELKFSFIILGNAYNATCTDGKTTLAKCTPDPTPISPSSFGAISDISRLNVLDGNICFGTASGCSSPLELTTIGCADLDSCIVNNIDTISDKTRKGFCTLKVKKKKKKSIICNDNFQQAAPISMPALFKVPFQQWDSLKQPMTCDTKDKNDPIECEGNNGGNKDSAFPFYNRKTAPTSTEVATMTNADLVKGCYFSNTTSNSQGYQTAPNNNSTSINCYFMGEEVKSDGKIDRFIKGKNNLIVQTGVLPVNFFMYDYLRSNKRYAYDLEDAGIENSDRTKWFRLRILGEPPDPVAEESPISCGKTRIINTKDNNIDGAFIWLPNGWLEYAKTDSTDTSYNVIWACKFTAPTKKDKNYQIVTPKTFDAEVRSILPIILPGFSAAAGGTYRGYGSEDTPAS